MPPLFCLVAIASWILSTVCISAHSSGSGSQFVLSEAQRPDDETVLLALKDAQIIPDALDPFPVQFVIYPFWEDTNESAQLGNKINPEDVKDEPDLELGLASKAMTTNSKTVYTLVLSDPDALSRDNPVKAQMCHWIVTNITLPDFISTGGTLSLRSAFKTQTAEPGLVVLKSYFPPSPPPKTSYHRYVFAFLKSNNADGLLPTAPAARPHWGYGKERAGIREWAEENDLTVVGANFFYAQNKKQ